MTWFRVGGAGIPASLKNNMNSVLNKKFGTTGQNYPPNQWPDEVNLMGPLPEGTASGSIANISDGAAQVPIKLWNSNVDASVDGVSEVNGVKPFCPFLPNYESGSFSENKPVGTLYEDMKTINPARARIPSLYPIIPSGNMAISCDNNYRLFLCFFDENEEYLGTYKAWDTLQNVSRANGFFFSLAFRNTDYTTITASDYSAVNVKIETSQDTQYTISLGRTIHGGSLEFISGAGTDENGVNFTFDPISPIPETENVCNFWTDVGSSSIVYRRDIDLALQAVSSSRGLMMASRPVTQLVGEESDPDQVNELMENDETEQEGEDDAR